MPGIDELPVNRGLTAYGFEPGAIEERRQQRMSVEGLIQSSNRPRRALKDACERGINTDPGGDGVDLPHALQRRDNEVKALTLGDFTELYPLRFQCSAYC